jgi:hypothetical protein
MIGHFGDCTDRLRRTLLGILIDHLPHGVGHESFDGLASEGCDCPRSLE